MAVEGFVGWHGEGKTYCALRMTIEHVLALRRRQPTGTEPIQLYTNAEVRGTRRFHTWDDLIDICIDVADHNRRAVLLIDEAGVFLPARFWNKLDPRILQLLQERRKTGRGVDIYFTAPSFGHVDSSLRDVTQLVHEVKRLGGSEYGHDDGKAPLAFRVKSFDPKELTKAKRKPRKSRWFVFEPQLAALYDTATIDMSKPMAERHSQQPDYYGPEDRSDPPARAELAIEVQHTHVKRRRGLRRGR